MKKLFKGINKTAVIVTLLVVLPASFFAYQSYTIKKQQQNDIRNKKVLNQQAYDFCLKVAYYRYRDEERNMCWIYNHDATGCDLNYMVNYKFISELPKDKLDSNIKDCDRIYPPDERLYSSVSPDAEILPFGKVDERTAFQKVMQTTEYKSFVTYPIKEEYKKSYEVIIPTKAKPFWTIRLYEYLNVTEYTYATFRVDAISGELSKI